jgi:hypothetical protein
MALFGFLGAIKKGDLFCLDPKKGQFGSVGPESIALPIFPHVLSNTDLERPHLGMLKCG